MQLFLWSVTLLIKTQVRSWVLFMPCRLPSALLHVSQLLKYPELDYQVKMTLGSTLTAQADWFGWCDRQGVCPLITLCSRVSLHSCARGGRRWPSCREEDLFLRVGKVALLSERTSHKPSREYMQRKPGQSAVSCNRCLSGISMVLVTHSQAWFEKFI